MMEASGSALQDTVELMRRITEFLRTLYLFGESDIPVAALPSVCNEQGPPQ